MTTTTVGQDPSPTTTIGSSNRDVRIACLIPSATSICLALGLRDCLVGVTHECDLPEEVRNGSKNNNIRVLTKNGLTVDTQGEIHQAVQDSVRTNNACSTNNGKEDDIPSLYPLVLEELEKADPTVVLTQDLCSVCAPTVEDVRNILFSSSSSSKPNEITIVSLQPMNLTQVAENFVTVANACGVLERGLQLQNEWLSQFEKLQQTIQQHLPVGVPKPNMLVLEWLDPPFDGGHWTYQMMEYACIDMAYPKQTPKSNALTWQRVHDIDPQVLVVGCCGFDLSRNLRDALAHERNFQSLRAFQTKQIYVCDGNQYIAQPGPALLQGTVLLAKCAYQNQPDVLRAIEQLDFRRIEGVPANTDDGWRVVDFTTSEESSSSSSPPPTTQSSNNNVLCHGAITDMEDIAIVEEDGFSQVHKTACDNGETTYTDPETGYSVFTELAHQQRGYCCGSGCRHCPYNHANVKDKNKTSRIQQPAILYTATSESFFSVTRKGTNTLKVLFFSGGKDSFLTIRALVKECHKKEQFGLILLTTFDATERKVAHQDVSIDDIVRQARHLDITLVGVPLRRASGERYIDRIQKGITLIQETFASETSTTTRRRTESIISSLVFGDLHLESIKSWRDKTIGGAPLLSSYTLEYPLWKTPYDDLLNDLEDSTVPCRISASTIEQVRVGTMFDRSFYNWVVQTQNKTQEGITTFVDGFGECGEFHSLAEVWHVDRDTALGIV